MQRKFLLVAFVLLLTSNAFAFPASILDTPPYSAGALARIDNDSASRPINAAAKVDRATGKVWLAVAKEDISLPVDGGAHVRINSEPVTISSEQNIRTDVGVDIPAASVVGNSLAETYVHVAIRSRATGASVAYNYFPVTSGASANTRNLVVVTTTPPGAGDYYVGVDIGAVARSTGGLAAIGNGFKISNIALTARSPK